MTSKRCTVEAGIGCIVIPADYDEMVRFHLLTRSASPDFLAVIPGEDVLATS